MDVSERLAARLGVALTSRRLSAAFAESCTGGWLAKVATAAPGSSSWFDRCFVAYSNAAKTEMLGVSPETIEAEGAVSEAVVMAMAEGALARSCADLVIAISGVAGPGGGTPAKPVGTVWTAWSYRGGSAEARASYFAGDREMIRQQAVMAALQGALELTERIAIPESNAADGA